MCLFNRLGWGSSSEESEEVHQVRKCQYLCGETKSFKVQDCPSCTSNVCPDKYAELEIYGMMVCTCPTSVINSENGLEEYECVYNKCKKIAYDLYDSECPSPENTNDFSGCTSAGDVLIDEDQMFNELEDIVRNYTQLKMNMNPFQKIAHIIFTSNFL